VRHPVYLGVSLFLLSRPAQTEVSFLFSLLCAAYFVAGSFHEERRMVHLHGAAYEEYRRRVPPFLPAPWRKRS
jgi:protein-S-isoprenylcysteine O-methyltransferase Ste14